MPKLTALVGLRVSAEELALMDDLAARVGCSRTRLLRAAVAIAADADVDELRETVASLAGRTYAAPAPAEPLCVVRGRHG
jgi:hypothetical protein